MYFGSGLGLDPPATRWRRRSTARLGTPPKFSPLTNDSTVQDDVVGRGGGRSRLNPKVDYHNVEMLIYVGINPMVSHGDNNGMWDPAVVDQVRSRSAAVRSGRSTRCSRRRRSSPRATSRRIRARTTRSSPGWCARSSTAARAHPSSRSRVWTELRAALEGYDRATAAEIAGVAEQELEDLLAAIRRQVAWRIETGTGISMSAGANLTQWFCWLIMILTGSTNEKGGAWFHPGFFRPYEDVRARRSSAGRSRPASKTRPDVKGSSVRGGPDWPCAVLPLRDRGGQHPRASSTSAATCIRSFPDTNALKAALPKLELNVVTEIAHNELTPLSHARPADQGRRRASRRSRGWDTLAWNVSMQYTPAARRADG